MQDSLGNSVTTASPEALRLVDSAIDHHSRAWPGALELAQAATREDPALAIGHALQGLIHAFWGRRPAAELAMSQAILHVPSASARERSLVELVDHLWRGRTHAALAWLLLHLRRWPTDLLALTTAVGAYGLLAFSGRADHDAQRLALLDEIQPHYPQDFPWLLAYRGWARIEHGAADEGLDMALRAIAARPENAHNAHIVAHGFHELGRFEEDLQFIAAWLPGYPDHALMWGHLQWHAALAELALDQDAAAMDRCLGSVLAHLGRGAPFMGLADAASLLWRLKLRGAQDLPWRRADDHAREHFPKGSNAFGELHLAMHAAAARDLPRLLECRGRAEKLLADGSLGAGATVAWCRALEARLEGLDGQAHFAACEAQAVRLGGSHAQRSVITATSASNLGRS
jgi:tetratricopeptide (TPR) repeat protein